MTPSPSSFSPLSVPWHSAFWASDPGWTPPGDGAAVATWRDASGGGHDATQATGSKQPLYRSTSAGMNNRPIVEFDGTDDFLRTAAFTALAQANQIVVIARLRSVGGATMVIIDGIGTSNRHNLQSTTTPQWQIQAGSSQVGGTPDTSRHFLVATFAATDALDIDGAGLLSGSAGTNSLTGLTLGARFDDTTPAPVDIAFVGLADVSISAQIPNLLAWSRSFYATP